MHILALGLNHRTAPVTLRERFALDGERLATALAAARAETREVVILSTCNRTEVYAVTAHVESGLRALRRLLAAQAPGAALAPCLYELVDADAAGHLLRVAAGLDSLILGEPQILGQVRGALAAAREAGAAGPVLTRLCHTALAAGKEARATTGIARNAASVGHAAITLAREICGGLAGREVLVLGAGKMAALTAGALVAAASKGAPAALTIVNRTPERAAELAARLGGRARPFADLPDALVAADIVVAATGAPEPLVTPEVLAPALARRAGRPLLLLDIAVPRDVAPAVGTLPGVTLRDIDDLQGTVAAGLAARRDEVAAVEALLDRHAAAFWEWQRARDVAPTITALRAKAEEIRAAELARTLARLGHLDERDRNTVAALSVAIANKLLHEPTMRLKRPGDGGDYARAAAELFGLAGDDAAGESGGRIVG
ncbi:MAG TPA: glutamyl-tRNA reductase [Thermomicrobiales bacterium]|nr:glutamyl-tRNA reductase [Thermomicrobiales bacterium]